MEATKRERAIPLLPIEIWVYITGYLGRGEIGRLSRVCWGLSGVGRVEKRKDAEKSLKGIFDRMVEMEKIVERNQNNGEGSRQFYLDTAFYDDYGEGSGAMVRLRKEVMEAIRKEMGWGYYGTEEGYKLVRSVCVRGFLGFMRGYKDVMIGGEKRLEVTLKSLGLDMEVGVENWVDEGEERRVFGAVIRGGTNLLRIDTLHRVDGDFMVDIRGLAINHYAYLLEVWFVEVAYRMMMVKEEWDEFERERLPRMGNNVERLLERMSMVFSGGYWDNGNYFHFMWEQLDKGRIGEARRLLKEKRNEMIVNYPEGGGRRGWQANWFLSYWKMELRRIVRLIGKGRCLMILFVMVASIGVCIYGVLHKKKD